MRPLVLFALLVVGFPISGIADGPADNVADAVRPIPPVGDALTEATAKSLTSRCLEIRSQWRSLVEQARVEQASQKEAASKKKQTTSETSRLASLACEVLVFPRAVELAIEWRQFYKPYDADVASRLLDEAAQRMQVIQSGGTWSEVVGLGAGHSQSLIVGGYVSKIDQSIQPYGLVLPSGLAIGDARPRRLDIWFHGRGERLSEIAFLSKQQRDPGQYTPPDTIVLHPYGRYSNAFKFAGEVDVLEALDYVRTRLPVDSDRISVRGFSMGGAACWQFATHYSDRWFAANPGAGFSETPEFLNVFQGEDVRKTAPDYQRTLWQLYDCPPWARNLRACPTVAYSGEIDRQKQAADIMQAALSNVDIDMVHVIGPQTAHKIHPQSKVEIESRMNGLSKTVSRKTPQQVDFTTFTLRYHRMHWVDVRGLIRHWSPTRVQAHIEGSSIHITTKNVSRLRLNFGPGQWTNSASGKVSIKIDGNKLLGPLVRSDRGWTWEVQRSGQVWMPARQDQTLRKEPGLQGPIDDAFMDSFLFVLPSQQSSDPKVQQWVDSESKHAILHWRKHFRGDVRQTLDTDVTPDEIDDSNLILFGDSESNLLIATMLKDLPVQWDHDRISIGEASVPHAGHVPAMIFPNPLNPKRYVVLNSGFTFREYDYLNNARQTPKLPDWALIDIRQGATTQNPGVVKSAGFFDESWKP